jgi:hypothetical protein
MNFKHVKNILQLRFILQQPSIYWKDFSIDEIKLKIANPVINYFNFSKMNMGFFMNNLGFFVKKKKQYQTKLKIIN